MWEGAGGGNRHETMGYIPGIMYGNGRESAKGAVHIKYIIVSVSLNL